MNRWRRLGYVHWLRRGVGVGVAALVFGFVVGFGAHPAAAAEDYYSLKLPGDVLASQGISLSWREIQLALPPGAFVETTRVRVRDRGPFPTDDQLPALPKSYRSARTVYSYFLSDEQHSPVYARIDYEGKRPFRRRRVFFLEPGGSEWRQLRTVVDVDNQTARVELPQPYGKLVVATHRYKKETPIPKATFTPFPGTPLSDTAAVLEPKSGTFLYRQEADKVRSIASLTKLATTLVFLESDPNLDQVVRYRSSSDRIGATVPLADGDQLTLKQVLMGVLLPSANNMAVTLSLSTPLDPGLFVVQMNNRARELHLGATQFVEPTGLDERNVSSAGNLARLSRTVYRKYPALFKEAADSTEYHFTLSNSGESVTLHTTNKFDGHGKVELVAFKTGYLPGSAERTLTALVRESATGHEIIVVLLGNPQYGTIFQEAYDLAEWAFANWEFHNY
jgi:D-alanyl-D-alanine endopeptidase (penicillin-binding protein 7)